MASWIEGKVVENIHWSDSLFSLKVDADVEDFSAGQFTSLALIIDGEKVARPYSYLSSPHQRPLEFFFYTATDGVLSNALYALEVGDIVLVKAQANGFFVLDEVPQARDLWMIGTGTGVAPYLSILNSVEVWDKFQNIILVQGVRSQEDLQYEELIKSITQAHNEQFRYQAFVSRETVERAIHGRIPAAIESGLLEQKVGCLFDVKDSQIMLCGNPAMVKDAQEMLKTKGFAKNLRRKPGQITTENYW